MAKRGPLVPGLVEGQPGGFTLTCWWPAGGSEAAPVLLMLPPSHRLQSQAPCPMAAGMHLYQALGLQRGAARQYGRHASSRFTGGALQA